MRILRIGTQGADVAELQTALGVSADGKFGPQTLASVKGYQASHGLVPDGIVGPHTSAMIFGLNAPKSGSADTVAQIIANFEEGTVPFYEAAFRILEYDKGTEEKIRKAAELTIGTKIYPWYQKVEALRGVPAIMISTTHSMECNNNPRGVLHNGELIVGTGRKTTLVPKGRGPFNKKATLEENWIDAALDAIDTQATWRVPEWSVGYILKQEERFNGWGYVTGSGKDETSPYIWACSNINDGLGKYTSDGKFNPRADANTQVGVATQLHYLWKNGRINLTFTTK